jgi:hypothetical protein
LDTLAGRLDLVLDQLVTATDAMLIAAADAPNSVERQR